MINDLIQQIRKFNSSRDWDKYHTFKNLSMALMCECAELQEMFLWDNNGKSYDWIEMNGKEMEIQYEIADIFIYLLNFCDKMGYDEKKIKKIIKDKLKINNKKYPVVKSKGNCKKYTEL